MKTIRTNKLFYAAVPFVCFLLLIACSENSNNTSSQTKAGLKPTTYNGELVDWQIPPAGFEQAIRTGKPVLLMTYTEECFWCEKMSTTIFADKAAAQFIEQGFVPVKINAHNRYTYHINGEEYNNASLVRDYTVRYNPTFIVIDPESMKALFIYEGAILSTNDFVKMFSPFAVTNK